MKTLRDIIIAGSILLSTFSIKADSLMTKAEGERALRNIVNELVVGAEEDKLILYGSEYFQYDTYFNNRVIPIHGAAFIGFDYKADSTSTNDNKADLKSNLFGSYYLNCQASDSAVIRTEVADFLVGKTDLVATEPSTWSRIKKLWQ